MSSSLLSRDDTFGAALKYLVEQAWDRNEWGDVKVTGSNWENSIGYSDATFSRWIRDQGLPPETLIIDRIGKSYICTEEEYIWLMGVYVHHYSQRHEEIPQQQLARLEAASKEFLKDGSESNKNEFYAALIEVRGSEGVDDELSVTDIKEHFERENHYQNLIEKLADLYSRQFNKFIRGSQHLAIEGDTLLDGSLTAAYDLLIHGNTHEHYPDFLSSAPLIFYCNYLGRIREVVHLLSEMEKRGIITREDTASGGMVKLGVKASRRKTTSTFTLPLDKVVDIVLTFVPSDADKATDIIEYLFELPTLKFPDIRATMGLPYLLYKKTFAEAVVHSRINNKGTLLILQSLPGAAFEGLNSQKMRITQILFDYLSSFERSSNELTKGES